jgi:hypothetical protein
MMAPDRPTESEGRFPSREALDRLRAALSRYITDGSDERPVCDALSALALEAKDRKLYAEHMLIAFKRVWNEMPEVLSISSETQRRETLSRLVKLCIDSYYTR